MRAKTKPAAVDIPHGEPEKSRNGTVAKVVEGAVVTLGGETYTAKASCGLNTTSGRWICLTHDEGFANQLQKDLHIGNGHHVMGWVCPEHGLEVP